MRSLLTLFPPEADAPARSRRPAVLAVGLVLLAAWQLGFAAHVDELDPAFPLEASTGAHEASLFVYFLHHLGLYPVAFKDTTPWRPKDRGLADSTAAARQSFERRGRELAMDVRWTFRAGERGKVLAYLPSVWFGASALAPTLRPTHRAAFLAALAALFAAAWSVGRWGLGAWLVLLIGSNPFQLLQVHGVDNVFSWTITTAVLLLALHLPLLFTAPRRPRWIWLVPLVSGVLLATVRTIRSEPYTMVLGPALVYATLVGASWPRRGALLGVFALALMGTSEAWSRWHRAHFETAAREVRRVGGDAYEGPYVDHHEVWHPIWCGLGDFGGDKGYAWDDRAAADYAEPVLARRHGVAVPAREPEQFFYAESFWGDSRYYPVLPLELPHYHEVVRDKVLSDIAGDPLWYAGILARRAWRILDATTPVRVSWWSAHVDLPFHGLLLLPALALLALARRWWQVKLIAFTLPTCLTALLVYSGRGTTFYGIAHLVLAALLASALADALAGALRRRPSADGAAP